MINREQDLAFIIDRLSNPGGTAEGSTLPPKQVGNNRVPVVTGLQILRTRAITGGTEFTIAWNNAAAKNVAQYTIYTNIANSDSGAATLVPAVITTRSPAVIQVPYTGANKVVIFRVQTVLGNGMSSSIANSPSCTGLTK